MYFLLNIVIFHSYVSLPEGTLLVAFLSGRRATGRSKGDVFSTYDWGAWLVAWAHLHA